MKFMLQTWKQLRIVTWMNFQEESCSVLLVPLFVFRRQICKSHGCDDNYKKENLSVRELSIGTLRLISFQRLVEHRVFSQKDKMYQEPFYDRMLTRIIPAYHTCFDYC